MQHPPGKSTPTAAPRAGPARARLRQRKQEAVRQAIRDAALDLFLAKGFENTTVEEIAARTGISRRTFFRYFASKDDLIAQGMEELRSTVESALLACRADGPVLDLFAELVRHIARQSAADPRARDIVRLSFDSQAVQVAQLAHLPRVAKVLEEAFSHRFQDPVARETARILAPMTLGAVGAALRLWSLEEGADLDRIVETVLEAIERLLCPSARLARRPPPAGTPRYLP